MSEAQEVIDSVRAINDAWLHHRFDELSNYFDEAMVLAMPGLEQRVEGRDPIIDSYRDFAGRATIQRFDAEQPRADVVGSTAITTTSFEIEYELEGTRYREGGTDLLIFARIGGRWQVVWRSVIPSDAAQAIGVGSARPCLRWNWALKTE